MYLLKWKSIPFFQQIFTRNLCVGPCKSTRALWVQKDKDLETWKETACHAEGKASGGQRRLRAVFPEWHGAGEQRPQKQGSKQDRAAGAKAGRLPLQDCSGTPHACSPNGTMVFTSNPTHLGRTTHEGNAGGKCKMLQSLWKTVW